MSLSTVYPGVIFKQDPFFEVDVQLAVPSVRLSPTLDDIQKAINRAAVAVLGSAKKMFTWGQAHIHEKDRLSFFDQIGRDTEIVKTVLLLTGMRLYPKLQPYSMKSHLLFQSRGDVRN
jgi:dynein heavy chain